MKCLEIFSGAGGLALGLEKAGFEHCAFVERNRHACATLMDNFGPQRVFGVDIQDFDIGALKAVDLVAGGPPCQPFSLGGKHKAHNDSRDMFPYAIKAIEQLAPKAFVFENVKGLLRDSFKDYFSYIILRLTYPGFRKNESDDWWEHLSLLRTLKDMSYAGVRYDVSFQLLNAADYGVPQTRERVVIVGVRSDLGVAWNFPKPTHCEDRLLWDQCVSGEYWTRHSIEPFFEGDDGTVQERKAKSLKARYGLFEPTLLPWQTIRDALSDVVDPETVHGVADHQHRAGARAYPGHTGSWIDWPSKTIKAGDHGVPGGENMIRYEDGRVRYFTVFEGKRIQTFPDDFRVSGGWGEAMRQIGNAVPVRLAEVLGKSLMQTLQQQSCHAEATKRFSASH